MEGNKKQCAIFTYLVPGPRARMRASENHKIAINITKRNKKLIERLLTKRPSDFLDILDGHVRVIGYDYDNGDVVVTNDFEQFITEEDAVNDVWFDTDQNGVFDDYILGPPENRQAVDENMQEVEVAPNFRAEVQFRNAPVDEVQIDMEAQVPPVRQWRLEPQELEQLQRERLRAHREAAERANRRAGYYVMLGEGQNENAERPNPPEGMDIEEQG